MRKKLKLENLEIKSFVTALNEAEKGQVMGASGYFCPSNPCTTPVMPSRDADCFVTRFDNQCLIAVSGGSIC